MKLIDYSEKIIIPFLKNMLKTTKAKGYILGLSGGIDSALVSLLCLKAVGRENFLCVLIPIESHPDDLKDALELCEKFNMRYVVKDLTNVFTTFKKENSELAEFPLTNVKVRLRMVELYALAQQYNYVVLGTDNLDERYTGYFTKYGDGACDLLPISKLTKREVFQLSEYYGCTKKILQRKPSAGLSLNQTDEDDLQVSYDELDAYVLNKKENLSDFAKQRIEHLHKISQHKRDPIPEAEDFIREWKAENRRCNNN